MPSIATGEPETGGLEEQADPAVKVAKEEQAGMEVSSP
jgi:hypothetical protein